MGLNVNDKMAHDKAGAPLSPLPAHRAIACPAKTATGGAQASSQPTARNV